MFIIFPLTPGAPGAEKIWTFPPSFWEKKSYFLPAIPTGQALNVTSRGTTCFPPLRVGQFLPGELQRMVRAFILLMGWVKKACGFQPAGIVFLGPLSGRKLSGE